MSTGGSIYIKLAFILLCKCCLFSSLVRGDEITLFVEDNFYPFSKEDGTGISNTIVLESFQLMGIQAKLTVYPFARLMANLENNVGLGGFNAVPVNDLPERYVFGSESIYDSYTYFYYHKNRPIQFSNLNELDRPDLRVGEVNGYIYSQEYLDLGFTRSKMKSDRHLIQMLMLNRLDLAYMTARVAEYHMRQLGIPEGTLVRVEGIGAAKLPLHVAFNREHPKAKYYADRLDRGLKLLKASGRYYEILNAIY
ncbi:amino acid ABC transporter [Oleiphilus messinensis]|uniref:Amino acid ABC transporter n=1 Tax=Oleiphilus messinensis TaxID=141451 RepID=A0A1Y0IA96_9GAMM|nr:transporter substrate-binding domain-containing protein [Oleiphilus messinensis]ARU57428.1 amino acid ABC transporter [Oleiphilus messinensis]